MKLRRTYTRWKGATMARLAAALLAAAWASYAGAAATAVTLSAAPPSPQMVGTAVVFGATNVTPAGTYEYRFWLKAAGVWSVVQPYGPSVQWTWDTTTATPADYNVQVDVRTIGSTAPWDVATTIPYKVRPLPATGVSLAPDPAKPSPQPPGMLIQWTAAGQGGAGSYEYRFWIRSAAGSWQVAQDYSATAVWTWDTTGLAVGEYYVEVDARSTGSTSQREAYAVSVFGLGTAGQPVTGVTLSSGGLTSPQPPGTSVTFTAAASGGSGTPEYRFWLRAGGKWSVQQAWSAAAQWTWNTTALSPGEYYVQVDARSAGSSAIREAYRVMAFGLGSIASPVTAVSLASSLPTPQPAGAPVSFTATPTGGGGAAEYRFWLRQAGGVWSIVRPWSPAAQWAWSTSGLVAGQYYVQVDARAAGSAAEREAAAVRAYALQSACTGPALGSGLGTGVASGVTAGGFDKFSSPWGGAGSEDVAYLWTAPATGRFRFDTLGSVLDTVLYLLGGSCGGPPLAGNDDDKATLGLQSVVYADLVAGQTVTVVVDGYGRTPGSYTLSIAPASEVGACDDGEDNDEDGYIDCGDADCRADARCGSVLTGGACTAGSQCSGGLCLEQATYGFPGGYCTELARLDTRKCGAAGNGVASDVGFWGNRGLCLDRCTLGTATCAAGYACREVEVGTGVGSCWPTALP